jgi:hypothetical protein
MSHTHAGIPDNGGQPEEYPASSRDQCQRQSNENIEFWGTECCCEGMMRVNALRRFFRLQVGKDDCLLGISEPTGVARRIVEVEERDDA